MPCGMLDVKAAPPREAHRPAGAEGPPEAPTAVGGQWRLNILKGASRDLKNSQHLGRQSVGLPWRPLPKPPEDSQTLHGTEPGCKLKSG